MSALLKLMQLSDPALPIGSYAHSAGLETYVQTGKVHDVVTAKAFITAMLSQNLQYNDAAFVSIAFDVVIERDLDNLLLLDDECSAFKVASQLKQASIKLGKSLLKIYAATLEDSFLQEYLNAVQHKRTKGNYCTVFGLISALSNIEKKDALAGFYYNAAAGYVTNCVKLIPMGQQNGQQILFSLLDTISVLANNSLMPDKKKLGRSCTALDISCMQHEHLYSRLYMS